MSPAQVVQGPSGGVESYSRMQDQPVSKTYKQTGNWVSKQFTV